MPPTSGDVAPDESKKRKATPGALFAYKDSSSRCWPVRFWYSLILSCLPQLSHFEFCLARIKYLPAQEKYQVQDFRNWMESSPETSIRSSPESPIIGLIDRLFSPRTRTCLGHQRSRLLKCPHLLILQLLKVLQVLEKLAVIELKGRRIQLFD